jgi:radical SAM protein with 4Fe4S-binding SPASM domain
MIGEDVTHQESRDAMELIMTKAMEFGPAVEILTVDNHADAVYLFLWAQKNYPELADGIWKFIRMNGGNRSGIAFGNVDYQGNVHPDQFTQKYTFGNVRERTFPDIWKNTSNPILEGLKNRKPLLKGRCSLCKWLDVCNGNFRARAESVTGDLWASDPACYLSNEEIGVPKYVGLA